MRSPVPGSPPDRRWLPASLLKAGVTVTPAEWRTHGHGFGTSFGLSMSLKGLRERHAHRALTRERTEQQSGVPGSHTERGTLVLDSPAGWCEVGRSVRGASREADSAVCIWTWVQSRRRGRQTWQSRASHPRAAEGTLAPCPGLRRRGGPGVRGAHIFRARRGLEAQPPDWAGFGKR